jgi:hypothetical protein
MVKTPDQFSTQGRLLTVRKTAEQASLVRLGEAGNPALELPTRRLVVDGLAPCRGSGDQVREDVQEVRERLQWCAESTQSWRNRWFSFIIRQFTSLHGRQAGQVKRAVVSGGDVGA